MILPMIILPLSVWHLSDSRKKALTEIVLFSNHPALEVMPIEVEAEIRVFSQEEFHALDRQIMGIIFAVHNDFGRFLDEALFKRAILIRCIEQGIVPAETEARIRVIHQTFCKDYFMDLLFGGGLMVEAKTSETLTPTHRAHALNYLLLTGMKHGRLVNLRPARVQHEFVSTNLDAVRRRKFLVVDSDWREPNKESTWLKKQIIELLHDWGAFLEVTLYRDAVIHFLGGPDNAFVQVEFLDGYRTLGFQKICLLKDDTAFVCTAITHSMDQMREHQRRFLAHTRLRFLQWVNLNHARIEFTTIAKEQ